MKGLTPTDTNWATTFTPRDDAGKVNHVDEEKISGYAVWRQAFGSFAEGVSIVGFKYIFLSGANGWRRLLWLLFVLFGVGFMLYQVTGNFQRYFSYDTTVDIKVSHLDTVEFPSVTICNENRMTKSKLAEYSLTDVLEPIYPPWPDEAYTPTIDFGALQYLHDTYPVEDLMHALAVPLEQIAFDGVKFGVQCLFDGNTCNDTAWDISFTSLGRCLQFNINGDQILSRSGSPYGLILVLHDNESDYGVINSPARGFRVLMHDRLDYPAVPDIGLYMPSGYVHGFEITLYNTTQLPKPYGDCDQNSTYRRSMCRKQCEAKFFYEQCGCCVYYLPKDHLACNRSCSFLEEFRCLQPATAKWFSEGLVSKCDCPSQCNQITYQFAPHSSVMSDKFASFIADNLVPVPASYVQESYSLIYIYFSELKSEEIITQPGYTILSLLCDVGGAMGLVVGSTILTLAEFTDFFITSCWTVIGYKNKRRVATVREAKF